MPLVLDCDIQRRMDPLVLSAIVEHAAIRHSTMPQDDPKAAIWTKEQDRLAHSRQATPWPAGRRDRRRLRFIAERTGGNRLSRVQQTRRMCFSS
jgi:hypothetical protein